MGKNGGGGMGNMLKLALLLGGVGVAAYVVYKIYQQKVAADADTSALPGTTDVTVDDPYPKKPAAKKVTVPARFV